MMVSKRFPLTIQFTLAGCIAAAANCSTHSPGEATRGSKEVGTANDSDVSHSDCLMRMHRTAPGNASGPSCRGA